METAAVTIGRIVHYVAHGTPIRKDGTQAFPSVCRAAIVTAVTNDEVSLCVINPTGFHFHTSKYDDGGETPGNPDCPHPHTGGPFRYCPQPGCGWREAALKGGTWHWPERETPDALQ